MGDAGGARPAVLVVEDNPVNQRVAAAMLEHLGYQVGIAADGKAAVRAATGATHCAILMDCQLPILDGYEATREIRRRHGASRRVPIVAVTASALETDHERCRAAGMDDHLVKPLSVQMLAVVIVRWVAPDHATASAVAAAADDRPIAPAPGRNVLDVRVIERLERLGDAAGQDLVGQLTGLFRVDASARLHVLRAALEVGDADAVSLAAHALGGASHNIGATDLARLCGTLAAASSSGDLLGGGALLDAVDDELSAVHAALESLAPRRSA